MSVQLQRPALDDQDVGDRERPEAPDRFSVQRIDGELTVWDAERRRHLVHEQKWDEQAAALVVESLSEHPTSIRDWDWSEPWA